MELLGSPQGAHDAPAHLLGVPHRVQHAATAVEELSPLLAPAAGCREAAGQTTGGASLHLVPSLLPDTNEAERSRDTRPSTNKQTTAAKQSSDRKRDGEREASVKQ